MPEIIAVTGPTAVGKTAYTIELAKQLNTIVVSCDSRQFYREMTIGTAKPTPEEMEGVPHYFVDNRSVENPYTAGSYEKEVIPFLEEHFKTHEKIILTGGSGMYLDAVLFGIDDIPDVAAEIVQQLEEELTQNGLAPLQEELQTVDPAYFAQTDPENARRVLRALGVYRTTGKPFSHFHGQTPKQRPFDFSITVLNRNREELYQRINHRVDLMLEQGLEAEAKALYPLQHLKPLQTVGYQEWFDYFDGNSSREKAIELIKRNSRRYAKRQLTWFRRYADAKWVELK